MDQLYLIVDDDAGKNYESRYKEALDALGKPYSVVDSSSVSEMDLIGASAVIWFCGDDSSNSISSTEANKLKSYLDAGGELILFGQDIGYDIKGSSFLKTYLKAKFVSDKAKTSVIAGEDGSFLAGFAGSLSVGDAVKQGYPEVLAPLDGASVLVRYGTSSEIGAIAYEGNYKVAYFGFGLEGISGPNARKAVLEQAIAWTQAGSGSRKAKRAKALSAFGQKEGAAAIRLQAEVVDEARRLGKLNDRDALEALIDAAGEEARRPLLRAYLQAVYGTTANR